MTSHADRSSGSKSKRRMSGSRRSCATRPPVEASPAGEAVPLRRELAARAPPETAAGDDAPSGRGEIGTVDTLRLRVWRAIPVHRHLHHVSRQIRVAPFAVSLRRPKPDGARAVAVAATEYGVVVL